MFSRRGFLFVVPVIVPGAVDALLTLAGQPSEYWSGNFSASREWNPLGRILLQQHPLLFAGIAFAWVGLVSLAILRLPLRLAAVLSFVVMLVHALCGACWLWRLGPIGIVLAIAYLVLVERIWSVVWRRHNALISPAA